MAQLQRLRVVSSIPGRVRLKVARSDQTPEEMQRIVGALAARPEVKDVRASVRTGGILVHYDPERGDLDGLGAALAGIGVALVEVAKEAKEAGTPPRGNSVRAAANLRSALGRLDRRVESAAGGTFDLRLLVPLGLGALAVRQMLREGLRLDEIPWYVLAWDAFQSFNTLHRRDAETQPAMDQPGPAQRNAVGGV
jgi:hypothetical protein